MNLTNFLYPFCITLGFSGITAVIYHSLFFKKHIATAIVLFSTLVFSIVYFVSFENNIGLGIGLLGILSLIRLRTTVSNLTDIGFAFYAITIGLLNASIPDIRTILIINALLSIIILLLASRLIFRRVIVKTQVIFDDLDFEKLNDQKFLMKRVEKDLKIKPLRVSVSRVDYLKDSVTLKVTYEMH